MTFTNAMATAVLSALMLVGATGCDGEDDRAIEGSESHEAAEKAREEAGGVLMVDDNRPVAQKLQDFSIAANVELRLAESRQIDMDSVSVAVQSGRVTLTGAVASAEALQKAVAAARGVEGVSAVDPQLTAPDAPPPAERDAEALAGAQTPTAEPSKAAQPPAPAAKTPEKKTPEPKAAAETTHTVRSGDNLWVIAKKYNTSVANIKKLNNLKSDKLRAGQKLRVK